LTTHPRRGALTAGTTAVRIHPGTPPTPCTLERRSALTLRKTLLH
jgi:hypothetical protein